MCGIVGLLSAMQAHSSSAATRQQVIEAAKQLHQQDAQLTVEVIEQDLEVLAAWLEPLPCFETSFTLGASSDFGADLEVIRAALQLTLERVQMGQQQAESFQALEVWNKLGIRCQDLLWRLTDDILEVQKQICKRFPLPWTDADKEKLRSFWEVEFVLRGLHRLEIRGRDSGGISIMTRFPDQESYQGFLQAVTNGESRNDWQIRQKITGLMSGAICGSAEATERPHPCLAFLYKVASEVGSIGQNIEALRDEIYNDAILKRALAQPGMRVNSLTHTRWASNGIINVPNAHPQGNDAEGMHAEDARLFAVLNGDVDNFKELLADFTARTGREMPQGVTTDAKIIPLLVEERYRENGGDMRQAFLEMLRKFEGSFAIALHHLDQPDKVWLGIGGSGQALYVGVHEDAVYYASELYGVVEATSRFVKLDGEREREPGNPASRGQMLEIRRDQIGQERPFTAWSFDGVSLDEDHLPLQTAQITTRDINIAGFNHFFIKEISESVQSVSKTLHGRFFLQDDPKQPFLFNLDESTVPASIVRRLQEGRIRQIYCIGQGTAAVAAMGVANALQRYMKPDISIRATKATELSGHMLTENMEDVLAIAVSQSGTTTDTNRTVDLIRQREGKVLAILNRRNSDLAFKADGVIFTSDGRDVEMSVASTKAFYSQVTAGALLALYLAYRTESISAVEVHQGLKELSALPEKMKEVLAQSDRVREVASTYGLQKRYWAVVGSGQNQISAHEIRIKLSELCYKSISCDFIEDKKHIDLSAEPLMLVCATGLDQTNLSDSVKEVAIFKAHSSIPIVIANRGAENFEPYATAVFKVPDVPEHLSPILTTIIGHLFGYHAACAIDEQALGLRRVRQIVRTSLPELEQQPELVLGLHEQSPLRDQLLNLLKALQAPGFNSTLEVDTAVRMSYLSQRLLYSHVLEQLQDVSEETESPYEIAQRLLQSLSESIQELTRPIDAIKHQAKTVTVGISRPSPKLNGVVGHIFRNFQLDSTQLLWRNLSYLIAAEPLFKDIKGAILYRVENLDEEGQPSQETQIFKEEASGIAADLPSRTESDHSLRGSKWLAIKNSNVLIGVGRHDERQIAIIPLRGLAARQSRILLLHLDFDEQAALDARLQMLRTRGSVYDQFRASVTEINRTWSDDLLSQVPVSVLFDDAPERFVDAIAGKQA